MAERNGMIHADERAVILFHVATIVALTVVVNGTTAGWLYNTLDIYPENYCRPDLRERGLTALKSAAKDIEDDMGEVNHAHPLVACTVW